MQTEKILLTVTQVAATNLAALTFVNHLGAVPSAGQLTLGIANADYSAGEQAGVNTHGELLVLAGAAITVGAEVQTDAQGRAVPRSTGAPAGVARDAAAAAGSLIRVLR